MLKWTFGMNKNSAVAHQGANSGPAGLRDRSINLPSYELVNKSNRHACEDHSVVYNKPMVPSQAIDNSNFDYIPLVTDVDPLHCNMWRRVPRVYEAGINASDSIT